jgi:hypothetical protein
MGIDKLLDYIGWTFLVATILLLRLAEKLLDNIIKSNSFLLAYSFYGLILSATVLFFIYRTNPGYFEGGEKRASAVLSYFFGLIALFVFGAAYYNLETAKMNTRAVKAFVTEKSQNFRYKSAYLTIEIENRTERFQPMETEWVKIAENDTILLTVGRGQLGYEHILKFTTDADNLTDEKTDSHQKTVTN